MKMSKLFTILFFILLLVGCGKKEIVGTEKVMAQARNVSPFTAVNLSGYYNVNITVGPVQSVVLKMNGNLLPYIDSTVRSKTLKIESKKGYLLRPQGIPEVDIVVSSLTDIELSGNNHVNLGSYSGDSLELNFAGSNQFVGQGVVNSLKIKLSGNSVIDAQKLMANKVDIDSNGNSQIFINAKENLTIKIDGNGVVNYSGNPKLSQTINGSGTITKQHETVNK